MDGRGQRASGLWGGSAGLCVGGAGRGRRGSIASDDRGHGVGGSILLRKGDGGNRFPGRAICVLGIWRPIYWLLGRLLEGWSGGRRTRVGMGEECGRVGWRCG